MPYDLRYKDGGPHEEGQLCGWRSYNQSSQVHSYSTVITREGVRIAFLVATLNDLDITAADVGNAYLNADCKEKIFFCARPEFGTTEGSVLIIRKALYGLKSSGAAWHALFCSTLWDLGYKPTTGDPDVWIRPASKPNGQKFYEMVLVYVNDILHLHHPKADRTNESMAAIGNIYRLKEGSIGPLASALEKMLALFAMKLANACGSYRLRITLRPWLPMPRTTCQQMRSCEDERNVHLITHTDLSSMPHLP